jgi:hypothetical protein
MTEADMPAIPIDSRRAAAVVLAVRSALGAFALPAEARVTRIVVDEKRSPAYDGKSFGRAGPYERATGRASGMEEAVKTGLPRPGRRMTFASVAFGVFPI